MVSQFSIAVYRAIVASLSRMANMTEIITRYKIGLKKSDGSARLHPLLFKLKLRATQHGWKVLFSACVVPGLFVETYGRSHISAKDENHNPPECELFEDRATAVAAYKEKLMSMIGENEAARMMLAKQGDALTELQAAMLTSQP